MEFEGEDPPPMPREASSQSVLDESALLVVLFDEPGAKQVAEAIRKAGFKVSYVHRSYLHVRTTL